MSRLIRLALVLVVSLTLSETSGQCSNTDVITIAGDGTFGFMDGLSTAAQFRFTSGVAIDGFGNIIVADFQNNRIRQISPDGVVTTIAGDGTSGFMDGPGTAAQFFGPAGVAIDGLGNIIVADQSNHRIRQIGPDGVVTTIAGDGTSGFMDGPGTAAQFFGPVDVAIDGSGNIIVADFQNNRIRKISSGGVVTTIAGQFNFPAGVAIDGLGNIIVADAGNHRIRQISPDSVVTTIAGDGISGFMDGPGTVAQFRFPAGVAVDSSGNIIVADFQNNRIRKISSGGVVTTIAGDGTFGFMDGPGTAAQFNLPVKVAIDGFGNIIVADESNHRIRQIGNCISVNQENAEVIPTIGEWSVVLLSLLFLIIMVVGYKSELVMLLTVTTTS